ncbi:retinol dehydrogenase 1 isoform X2 [Amia ocellicauda]|uniref:retinol dehydrogenase 1 isoform X2 n=1 Tax=Amia ocellicauda TaxID=2972642 RepID=UPI0034647FE3
MVSEVENGTYSFTELFMSNPVTTCILASVLALIALWYIKDSLKIDHIDQKYVLVTGCDTGFGNLLCKQLHHRGFCVIAACLSEKGADDLKAATSPRLKTVLLNVTDSTSIENAFQFVQAETGERGLWGLVNNAGRATPIGPTDWMQMEDYKKVLDVNLMGLIEVTLKFLPLLKKARGRVVNVASIMGRLSMIGGGYCLSKWGVESFSDSLRRDMHHFGVKVSIIEPGFFKTAVTSLETIEADLKRLWNCLTPEVRDSYGAQYFEEYLKAQRFSMNILCSSDISKVTNCMEHTLTTRHPRTRYGVGWDAKFFWLPLSYAPTCISDFILSTLLPVPSGNKIVQTNQVAI